MADITLLGASYTDVPAVTLPKTGGGTVTFYENGGGGSVTMEDVPNSTGTTLVITTGGTPTPSETWETLYEIQQKNPNTDTPYNYFWLAEQNLGDVYPTVGSVWRITIDTNVYRCTAFYSSLTSTILIGNPKYSEGEDDGSGVPFDFFNAGWGAWVGNTDLPVLPYTGYYIKIERLVTT